MRRRDTLPGGVKPGGHPPNLFHVSLSTTAFCAALTIPAGWAGVPLFLALYAPILAIFVFLERHAAEGLRRDEPGLFEWRLARLPLAVSAYGFGIAAMTGDPALPVAAGGAVGFAALSCALADARAWGAQGGGR